MAPSGECLRGHGRAYLIGLLATHRRLYLAVYSPVLNLVVVAVLRGRLGLRSIISVLRDRLLFNPCKVERYVLTVINEDYYYCDQSNLNRGS